MKITHNKSFWDWRDRLTTPLRSARNGEMTVMLRFNEESRYERPTIEKDILKATGVSFSPTLNARVNSILNGWRYVEETDNWEIGCYYHDGVGNAHSPDFFDHLKMIPLYLGQTGIMVTNWKGSVPTMEIQVYDFNQNKLIVSPEEFKCYGVLPTKNNRLVSSYAGGDPVIPQRFSYAREIQT